MNGVFGFVFLHAFLGFVWLVVVLIPEDEQLFVTDGHLLFQKLLSF